MPGPLRALLDEAPQIRRPLLADAAADFGRIFARAVPLKDLLRALVG